MTKLCNGSNKNIITIFRCGRFADASYAFIDMELCDFNLDEYNKWSWIVAELQETCHEKYIWNAMMQIASGLAFIHSDKEIHRDLKPSNGMYI